MKKVLLFIFSFFLFYSNTWAMGKISSIDIEVAIDKKGNALVTENWQVKRQDVTYFEKNFLDVADVDITDYKVTDANNSPFKEIKSWDENKEFAYYFKDTKQNKSLLFTTNKADNTFIITYKVMGMITKFDDVQGINWYFLSKNSRQEIEKFNIRIKGDIKYDETNTALYAIGNNITAKFDKGVIVLSASNLTFNSQIKLMTTFSNLEYQSVRSINSSFNDVYQKTLEDNKESMLSFLKRKAITIILSIIVIVIILIIIIKLINSKKEHDEYYGLKINKGKQLSIDDVNYYDVVPCDNDLYKIAFIAGYFKILKSKSDLLGALILKMIYENRAAIIVEEDKSYIKIFDSQYFDREIDSEFYNILVEASNNNILDNTKLNRYTKENYHQILDWFSKWFNEVLNDEFSKKNIIKMKKGFKDCLLLQDKIIKEAENILGVKKYLLNFNQVPRQTELTNEVYKNLLVIAELLGIGELVSKEILRKNPDNMMAQTLLDLQSVRHIYKDVYKIAIDSNKSKQKLKIN